MLSPWRNSSAIKLNRNSVLLSHHAAGGKPEGRSTRLFICYRPGGTHLQSNSFVIPCCSPTTPQAGSLRTAKPPARHCPKIGVGRYGFCRTGVVMDWRNKSDEIYFNHFYYNKTTKTACFTRRTTPSHNSHSNTKKKNSSSANT